MEKCCATHLKQAYHEIQELLARERLIRTKKMDKTDEEYYYGMLDGARIFIDELSLRLRELETKNTTMQCYNCCFEPGDTGQFEITDSGDIECIICNKVFKNPS